MDKLHTCCIIRNMIARKESKLHSSALHVRTTRHEDRMYALNRAFAANSRVPLQISRATVLGHACKCQV